MKFSVIPILIAGAGITQYASANPIRVIIAGSQEVVPNGALRLGHAVANANSNVAHLLPPVIDDKTNSNGGRRKKHSCGGKGKSLKDKAINLSNTVRIALGFPPIETHHRHLGDAEFKEIHGGLIRIFPFPALDAEGSEVATKEQMKEMHRFHHHSFKHMRGSFMRRIHHALMALGPWEGRAVAFVLGCGIGVLLRMVWVMVVVTFRMIRGTRATENVEYSELVFEHDAEELIIPPPQYNDEKVALVDDKPVA